MDLIICKEVVYILGKAFLFPIHILMEKLTNFTCMGIQWLLIKEIVCMIYVIIINVLNVMGVI